MPHLAAGTAVQTGIRSTFVLAAASMDGHTILVKLDGQVHRLHKGHITSFPGGCTLPPNNVQPTMNAGITATFSGLGTRYLGTTSPAPCAPNSSLILVLYQTFAEIYYLQGCSQIAVRTIFL